MSEYADIRVKGLSIYWFRNYLVREVVELFFTRQDLFITPDYVEDPEDEESTPYTRYVYKTTVGKARERLDVMGYGLNHFEQLFTQRAKEAIDYDPFLSHLNVDYEEREKDVHARIEKNVTFKKWTNSMKKIVNYELEHGNIEYRNNKQLFKASTECDKIIYYALTNDNSESFYAINTEIIKEAYIIRLILECCGIDDDIVLDFSFLANWADDCIPKAIETTGNTEKTIVLVEGTSDKDILEYALQRIYPHLADLFYFMEFSDSHGKKRAGGAPEIRKHMETFFYSKLRAKFIAVFDNDAVGYQNMHLLLNQRAWPENFKIICYPEISSFRRYPTLAPSGSIIYDDINRKACSIELYLPDVVIRDNGKYIPIEWENRIAIEKSDGTTEFIYQGVISNKDKVKRRFHTIKNRIEKGELAFILEEWERMKRLLDEIVYSFK